MGPAASRLARPQSILLRRTSLADTGSPILAESGSVGYDPFMLVLSGYMRVRRSCYSARVAVAALALLLLAAHIARAQNRLARTDAYADAAPASAEQSVPALAAYVAKSGSGDLTRARAVYRWVTRHVDYDVPGFLSGNYGDYTPEGV